MVQILTENPEAGATELRKIHKVGCSVINMFYMSARREINKKKEENL